MKRGKKSASSGKNKFDIAMMDKETYDEMVLRNELFKEITFGLGDMTDSRADNKQPSNE